ncbi:hypothetical protein Tco_1221918 [Tanacetum coccineum]
MRTRSQTRNLNRQQQAPPAVVEPFNLEEPFDNPPLVPMADNRTMAVLLQAPTEGCEDAIVIPKINANFELKHGLINLVQNKQFFGHDKEDPHAHIRYFNKITSTMRFPDIPSTSIKLMLLHFPIYLEGNCPTTDGLIIETTLKKACPHHGFTKLTQVDNFYNGLNENEQDSLNAAAGGNLLSKTTREALNIIEATNPSPKKVVERETEETTDKEQTNFQGNTAHIPPPVNPIPIPEPDVPKTLPKLNIPHPS